jgi:hypothetical protein
MQNIEHGMSNYEVLVLLLPFNIRYSLFDIQYSNCLRFLESFLSVLNANIEPAKIVCKINMI